VDRPASKIVIGAVVIGVGIIAISGMRAAMREPVCGLGFTAKGPRCMPEGRWEPPDARVTIPATTVTIGPSDWEAQGRLAARVVRAGPFAIDAYEVTVGRAFCPTCPLADPKLFRPDDPARAASGVTLEQARAYCKQHGGRLPTEDEWIVAAAGDKPRRYPWGDTGAVCRRAAWGLAKGPCASGADGPDTVGAHPDGATPLGVHDLAGNVAEWVEATPPAVRGGAWDTELATELRTWTRREVPSDARESTIGFRCAYDVGVR